MDKRRGQRTDFNMGLTEEEVQIRKNKNLVNYDTQPKTKTIPEIILGNVFTYFNIVIMSLAVIIIVVGILENKLFFSLKNCLFAIVLICNTIISTIQEIISKKTIDRLSLITNAKVTVIRDGIEKKVAVDEVVLDDIVKLNIGDQVVVDSSVLDGEVEVNEAFLTGEAEPVRKKKGDTILSGSFIVSGSAVAEVIHVGEENYISIISKEAKYFKKNTSIIMDSFNRVLKVLSVLIIPLSVILLSEQYFISKIPLSDTIYQTVAALVGMIPDGLLLLTSSVLAVSVVKLARYKVLVQQLYCIENLARVNVICLDKTGTLTEGKMEVADIKNISKKSDEEIKDILANMNYALKDESSTSRAIGDLVGTKSDWEVSGTIDFSSSRKFSAVATGKKSYYLGAVEFLLGKDAKKYGDELAELSHDFRVVALAYNSEELSDKPKNLKVLAFILIEDKVRKEAAKTLKFFKEQGVDVKVLSGDNLQTVTGIVKKCGIEDIKGVDVSKLSDEKLQEAVEKYNVFARVTPIEKKKIVLMLKELGRTVAMTGDGVNDVLALKEADCSVAMASGSDAAKNVSQLVLLDSNFKSLPHIVAEGRKTINNIERSASILLMKTMYTILLIILSVILVREFVFIPIQMTLITFFTVGVPSFVLALEKNDNIVEGNFFIRILTRGLPTALTVFINVLLITVLKRNLNISDDMITTVIVILTAVSGFIFLTKLCLPFNKLRLSLLVTMILGFSYFILYQYQFFSLVPLNAEAIIVIVVHTIFSVGLFNVLNIMVNNFLEKEEG